MYPNLQLFGGGMLRMTIFVVLGALLFVGSSSAHAMTQPPTTSEIMQDIQKIKAEKNDNVRAQLADDMSTDVHEVLKANAMGSLDDIVIDGLISLLYDTNDTVRGWSACAIGYFGPRAQRAVPALQNALILLYRDRERRGTVVAPPLDSSAFIGEALKRIQGEPTGSTSDGTSSPRF